MGCRTIRKRPTILENPLLECGFSRIIDGLSRASVRRLGIRRPDGPPFRLIGLYQHDEDFEPITLRSVGRHAHESLNLGQGHLVIGFAFDQLQGPFDIVAGHPRRHPVVFRMHPARVVGAGTSVYDNAKNAPSQPALSRSVVMPRGKKCHPVTIDLVDEPVFLIDPA